MKSWIFQGNPDIFDIDTYLLEDYKFNWRINQKHFAGQMAPGDEVFLWRSAGKDYPSVSGVVAIGQITGDSGNIPITPEEKSLYRKFEEKPNSLRIPIEIMSLHIAPKSVVKREWMKEDPVLKELHILKMANATNYLLKKTEADRLRELCANTGRNWNYQESVAGLWAYKETLDESVSRIPGSVVSNVALRIGRAVSGVYAKVMNFRSLDPTASGKGRTAVGEIDKEVWKKYFDPVLARLDSDALDSEYFRFWPVNSGKHFDDEEDYQFQDTQLERGESAPAKPEKRKQKKKTSSSTAPARSRTIGEQSLRNARYSCEVNINHQTFLRSDGNQFMEKHHLIPMEKWDLYELDLDHPVNIVSLCPICHRKIHLGGKVDRDQLIAPLFIRNDKLLQKIYGVTLNQLVSYYDE